jgi:hypothetical protein
MYRKIMREKITEYLNHIISRNELYTWALEVRNNFLSTSNKFIVDNYLIYPFIISASIQPEDWEAPSDKIFEEYIEILDGKRNYKYSTFLKLPQSVERKNISDIKQLTNNYIHLRKFMDNDIDIVENLNKEKEYMTINTIPDLIYCDMVNLITALPYSEGLDFNANTLQFNPNEINLGALIYKIRNLIDCYEGLREISLNLYYQNYGCLISVLV